MKTPSRHEAVMQALKALLSQAAEAAELPEPLAGSPEVLRGEPSFTDMPRSGLIALVDGDTGNPEVTLSPSRYFFSRSVPVTVAVEHRDDEIRRLGVDVILQAIAAQIARDDTLGEAVDMAEAAAPGFEDEAEEGSTALRIAEFTITLDYEAPTALG